MEGQLNEARRTVSSLTLDNKKLADSGQHFQQTLEEMRKTNVHLKEQLSSQRDQMQNEMQLITNQMREEQHQQESARMSINDDLNRVSRKFYLIVHRIIAVYYLFE